jgi:hypothetical protein
MTNRLSRKNRRQYVHGIVERILVSKMNNEVICDCCYFSVSQERWVTKCRDERDDEFAPPSSYHK